MVVPRAGVLTRPPYQNKTSRSSTRYRCLTNWMGSSSQWKAGNRLLGKTSSANSLILLGVAGHPSSHESFRARLKVQKSRSVIQQRCSCGLHQPFGRPSPSLAALASDVWITTYELGIVLSVKHIAGKENVHAHHLSRLSLHKPYIAHGGLIRSIALPDSQTLICPSTIASVSFQAPVAWMLSLR